MRPEDDPRWCCSFEADLSVLDLRDDATQAVLGVTLVDLVVPWSPDLPNRACRRVMEAALAAGADAIIVPSAALPGGWSIDVLPGAFERLRLVARQLVTPAPPPQPLPPPQEQPRPQA